MDGAHVRARTGDLVLTKDVLCQLSYVGTRRFCGKAEITGNHMPIVANLGIGSSRSDDGGQGGNRTPTVEDG